MSWKSWFGLELVHIRSSGFFFFLKMSKWYNVLSHAAGPQDRTYRKPSACQSLDIIATGWRTSTFLSSEWSLVTIFRDCSLTATVAGPHCALWGILKNRVFTRRQRSIEMLKAVITEELNKICRTVHKHCLACIDENGGHIEHKL